MRVIKRYPNRKLYDTVAKRYVTLEGLADLIRQGEDVHVVDHESGEDLTNLTLSQVILELARQRSGFLPQQILSGIIRTGGGTLEALVHSVYAPLGTGRLVDEEIGRRLDALVDSGSLSPDQSVHLRSLLTVDAAAAEVQESESGSSLDRLGIPSRADITRLSRQLEELARKIDALGSDPGADDAESPGI